MRILKNSSKTVFVITSGANQCPKLILSNSKALFRDDYRGELTIAKKALYRLIQM